MTSRQLLPDAITPALLRIALQLLDDVPRGHHIQYLLARGGLGGNIFFMAADPGLRSGGLAERAQIKVLYARSFGKGY